MEEAHLLSRGDVQADTTPDKPMLSTDVVIVGGGLAGSLTGAMLGRAGIDCIVVDPHTEYPPDFRCEKLDGDQVKRLQKTGLAEEILLATTLDGESWVARRGIIVDKRPGDQHGIFYAPLVNRVRALIPSSVGFCHTKATGLTTGAERQTVTLADGTTISARLAVLSNGLSVALRDQVSLKREYLSRCHSISIGFNMKSAAERHRFAFPALAYYPESPAGRAAFITMFPIGNAMRANLFVYRTMDDPWLSTFRTSPEPMLRMLMPDLESITGPFVIEKPVQIRPVDLYASEGHIQPGLVLVGDAFATACPASGNGARKVITDVERLCNVYVPQWLATPGMGAEKVAAFYADPVKRACDRSALNKAFNLKRLSIDTTFPWRARRVTRFALHLAVGLLRPLQARFGARPMAPSIVPALPRQGD
jgi:2-polyprenyl-6-methoxyphenol hydroxylase-like FAD-dependent oxidoreductase